MTNRELIARAFDSKRAMYRANYKDAFIAESNCSCCPASYITDLDYFLEELGTEILSLIDD